MMDAQTSGGTGFDAALKALEDLETDVAQARDAAPAPVAATPAIEGIGAIEGIEAIDFDIVAESPAPPAPAPAPALEVEAPTPDLRVIAVDPAPSAVVAPQPEPLPSAAAGPVAAQAVVSATPPVAKRSKLPAIAVGLGLFSSIVSAVGLVVVSRTVVGASLVVADARERGEQMKKVGILIHDLEALRAREQVAIHRQEAVAAAAPITAQDLDKRLDSLRESLAARDQTKAMIDRINDGQSQLNETLVSIGAKVSRIEAKIDAKH